MSMLLPPFHLHEPRTVEEAVKLKAEFPDSDWLAGGTDLLPNYKWALNARKHVISLHRVEALRALTAERLGALATLRTLQESAVLKQKLPVLPATAGEIASPLIRNSATLGGNLLLENRCFFFNQSWLWRESKGFCKKADGDACLVVPQKETCYATFSADMPAPLITLDASLVLASARGTREVKVRDFYGGDGMERNQRQPGELLTEVRVPASAQKLRAGYKKLRQRGSWDFPEMGMAAALRFEGDRLVQGHLVANALEMAPRVLDELLQPLLDKPLTDAAIEQVAQQVEDAVRPVKNTSLPPSYRKAMTRPFTKKLLTELRDGTPVIPGPHHRSAMAAQGGNGNGHH